MNAELLTRTDLALLSRLTTTPTGADHLPPPTLFPLPNPIRACDPVTARCAHQTRLRPERRHRRTRQDTADRLVTHPRRTDRARQLPEDPPMKDRPCPVDGCPAILDRAVFVCRRHWFQVPLGTRRDVMTAYSRWKREPLDTATIEALMAAQAEALAAIQ